MRQSLRTHDLEVQLDTLCGDVHSAVISSNNLWLALLDLVNEVSMLLSGKDPFGNLYMINNLPFVS